MTTLAPPGLLPEGGLKVQALHHISPSRFTALRRCALREVCTAAGQAPLLPSSSAAAIGTVIHGLLEKAGRGDLASGEIAEEWDRMVRNIEQRMEGSWLDQALVPLERTFRHYAVRRSQAAAKARQLALQVDLGSKAAPAQGDQGSPRARFEVPVQAMSGGVRGRIDCLCHTEEGLVLRDYKSGAVLETTDAPEQQVKEDYQIQLRLYAALYHAAEGEWPTRLEIVPLQGDAVTVPFEQAACSDLLNSAVDLLRQVNQIVGTYQGQGRLEALAATAPDTCRYCSLRPGCPAYHKARSSSAAAEWPVDARGKVLEKRLVGNGRAVIVLDPVDGSSGPLRLRGIDSDHERHPALPRLDSGDVAAAYNLRADGAPLTFTQAANTIIYKDNG